MAEHQPCATVAEENLRLTRVHMDSLARAVRAEEEVKRLRHELHALRECELDPTREALSDCLTEHRELREAIEALAARREARADDYAEPIAQIMRKFAADLRALP